MGFASRPVGGALLHLATEVEPDVERDFNRWSEGHLKDNLALRGFLGARRLRRCEDEPGTPGRPTYLTLYDLTEPDAIGELDRPTRDRSMPAAFSGRFRFERALFRALGSSPDRPLDGPPRRETSGPAILHIMARVEPDWNEAFLDWYVGEHVPAVAAAPGVLGVRRFENTSLDAGGNSAAGEFRYLTIYELQAANVVSRPETIEAALSTPCPERLEPHRRFAHQVYEEFLALEAAPAATDGGRDVGRDR